MWFHTKSDPGNSSEVEREGFWARGIGEIFLEQEGLGLAIEDWWGQADDMKDEQKESQLQGKEIRLKRGAISSRL